MTEKVEKAAETKAAEVCGNCTHAEKAHTGPNTSCTYTTAGAYCDCAKFVAAKVKDERTPEEKRLDHLREQIADAEAKVNQMKSELATAAAEAAAKADEELTDDERNERVREQAKAAAQSLRTGTPVNVA